MGCNAVAGCSSSRTLATTHAVTLHRQLGTPQGGISAGMAAEIQGKRARLSQRLEKPRHRKALRRSYIRCRTWNTERAACSVMIAHEAVNILALEVQFNETIPEDVMLSRSIIQIRPPASGGNARKLNLSFWELPASCRRDFTQTGSIWSLLACKYYRGVTQGLIMYRHVKRNVR